MGEHYDRWEAELMRPKHRKGGRMRWWEWVLAAAIVAGLVALAEPMWRLAS